MRSHDARNREIVWAGIRTTSLDYCIVRKEPGRWRFTGLLIMKPQTHPFAVSYEILVSERFNARSLIVERTELGIKRRLEIQYRRDAWFVDDKERTDLRKCTDVDIEASPVTNTIAIRRTRLKLGQRVNLAVVWVRFPSLEITCLQQRYKRMAARKYLYESASGFSAELQVDDFGLVTRYGNIWKQVN